MATGGQTLSSEEAFDYNCTPCSEIERYIEAKRFCVECGENFCSTCLSWHQRFSATKGHTLIKCEEITKNHVPTRFSKCEVHTDKDEDMVCCDHNVVCCRVCITKDHRLCQGIDYLPDSVQQFKQDEKFVEIKRDLNERIEDIKSVHKEYTAQSAKLQTRKNTYLKRLEIFQKSVADFVKLIVTKAEKDVEIKFGPDICSMQKHIRKYNELLSKLNCLSTDLASENDDIAEFKKVLECKRTLKEIQIESCSFDDKSTIDEFQNEIKESVFNSFKNDQFFGSIKIVDSGRFDVPNLCLKEQDSSTIVLLTDFNNYKIKRIDRNYLKEIDSFGVEGHVWGICEVDSHELAFTLPNLKKVQFISADRTPVLKTSFPTNFKCRGIAYHNSNVYLTGGGMNEEEKGQVQVFDLKGKLLQKFSQNSDCSYFSIPRSIVVDTEGIYVTDQRNGIICLDFEGKRKWVCNNSNFKFPWGLCLTPNDNLLVSGHESNNIVIISKDGEFLGELLNERDGLRSPKALSIDIRDNCIIVSELKSQQLKMFYFGNCEI